MFWFYVQAIVPQNKHVMYNIHLCFLADKAPQQYATHITQDALYFQLYCTHTHTHTHTHACTHAHTHAISSYFGCIMLSILINLQKTNVKYVAMYFSSHITTMACRHPSVFLHPSSKCNMLPIMQVSIIFCSPS